MKITKKNNNLNTHVGCMQQQQDENVEFWKTIDKHETIKIIV